MAQTAEPVFAKYSDAARVLTFDFATALTGSDALTGSATVTADAGLTAGAPARTANKVTVLISGGTDQKDYLVKMTCSSVAGAKPVLHAIIAVRTRDAN